MNNKQSGEYQKGRKNLIFATLISIPGPLLLAISMTGGSSATQLADFIRRSCEFLTIFLAWLVYEITARSPSERNRRNLRLEVFIKYFTGISMALSGVIMIYVAIANFADGKGSVITSLILAVIGAAINAKLFFNYRSMGNAILSVQARLHRVKMLLDCFMAILLIVWIVLPLDEIKNYADVIGSCSISVYLIWSGIRVLADKKVPNGKN